MSIRDNAKAQAFYREVNEGIASMCEGWELETLEILCECGRVGCSERVLVDRTEYERVRAVPTQFVLKPGHDDPTVERVLSRTDEYVLVANHGSAAEIARQTDPRAVSR